MNASTFTARVVASTGADVPAALSAAVGALSGPLHGGAPSRVLRMLDEVERTGDAVGWVRAALDRGERLMGFGHRVYRAEDPRARVLRRAARELGAPRFEVAEELERAALEELRARKPDRVLATNVEYWSAVVLDRASVPQELFTALFACARSAGWSAHILEQRRTGRLVRPIGGLRRAEGARPDMPSLRRVRFGIFFEHQLPRPWGPDDEHDLLQDALEQVEVAERSGIDYVWQVEHHFLEEYSHGSASDVFLAAASQRAKRSGSASGSSRCRSATSTPRGSRRPPRRSTSSPAAASSWAPGRPAAASSCRASASSARRSAPSGRRPSTPSRACSWRSRSPARTGGTSGCRRATSSPSRARSPTRRSGSRARGGARSAWPRAAASAR